MSAAQVSDRAGTEREQHRDPVEERVEVGEGASHDRVRGVRGRLAEEEPANILRPGVDMPVGAARRRLAGRAMEVREGGRDEGVVDACPVLAEGREEDDGREAESEEREDEVVGADDLDERADAVPSGMDDEEGDAREQGRGEGQRAGFLCREAEAGPDAEEERPGARLETWGPCGIFRVLRTDVADRGPEHQRGEGGEQRLLDEVRGVEDEEGGCAEQEDGRAGGESRESAAGSLLRASETADEPVDGGTEEDERQHAEEQGRAPQERRVEGLRVRVAKGLLEGDRRVVERGAMVVRRPVGVVSRLQEASGREGLVCLVGMECAVEEHQRLLKSGAAIRWSSLLDWSRAAVASLSIW